MLIKFLSIFCLISIFTFADTNATSIEELEKTLEEYTINYQERSYFGNTFEIDINDLDASISENFPDIPVEYVWEIFSNEPQTDTKLSTIFQTVGEKAIELNIFTNISEIDEDDNEVIEKKLLYSYDMSVFVYEKSIPILISNTVNEDALKDYIDA
jgi:hypothetical protein